MTSHRQRPLHAALARVAVAGVASLATVLAAAPAAIADPVDDLAPADTSSGTTSDEVEPEVAPTDETPAEDQPDSDKTADDEQAPAESEAPAPTAKAGAADEEVEDQAVEIVPQYGSQKFRVGVKFAPGTAEPGQTTAGSTFRIKISATDGVDSDSDSSGYPPFEGTEFTCTTLDPADPDFPESPFPDLIGADPVESESDGTTYCPAADSSEALAGYFGLSVDQERATARASTGSVEPETEIPVDQAFVAPPGSTVTVTQLTAADGFEPTAEPVVIAPCTNLPLPSFPICGTGNPLELEFLFEASTALFVNDHTPEPTPDPDPVADETDPVVEDADLTTNATLPDTGGADARLLGVAGLLVASGSALAVGARRRRDVLVP